MKVCVFAVGSTRPRVLRTRALLSLLMLGLLPVQAARADVRLPALFADGMVLQRDAQVLIWGWARRGERIQVQASWHESSETPLAETTTDEHGRWQVQVSTPGAGGPHAVTVAGDTTVHIEDLLLGDLWLCAGGSGMSVTPSGTSPAEPLGVVDDDQLRFFTVTASHSLHPQIDCEGRWSVADPQAVAAFSAEAAHFGVRLRAELGVPIGLIAAHRIDTAVEAWISEPTLRGFPEFAPTLDDFARVRDPQRRGDAVLNSQDQWWALIDRQAPARPADGWQRGAYDDSAWQSMRLPASLAGAELDAFDGLVYFRRTIELPDEWVGQPARLELGPIDDQDDAWINGQHVGRVHEPHRWNVARQYQVPAGVLVRGVNVVTVRVLDTGGPGGINGEADQLCLRRGEGPDAPRIELAGEWRVHVGAAQESLPPVPTTPALDHNAPTVLFNGMIAPLVPMRLSGVIWDQGPANLRRPQQYAALFRALIRDWRAAWGAELPFYYVQARPRRHAGDAGHTALLREAQVGALAESSTGVVVSLDLPADEPGAAQHRTIGRRLAGLALAHQPGRSELVVEGPRHRAHRVEGGAIVIDFTGVGSGLVAHGELGSFTIAGADRQFHEAHGEIVGPAVRVQSPAVASPVAVRYAWQANPRATLFNREGLPAAPLRSDSWPDPLPPVEDAGATEFFATEAGFEPLFNGKDLAGWVNVNCAPETWTVDRGRIVCSGVPTGVLRTEKVYENFVFDVEWRHLQPGGNAGIFVWSDALTARGQPFTRSVEVQVMDGLEGDGYTSDGDIFPIHGATMVPENGRGGTRAFPTQRRARWSPHWNHYRITCQDGAIQLEVNGVVVTRGHSVSPRRGFICLESEGSEVHFRNLQLRELPAASPPLVDQDVARPADGFRNLYNGLDLRGWQHGPEHEQHWTPTDWRLLCRGAAPTLWTTDSVNDFELICDWRWPSPPGDRRCPVLLPGGAVVDLPADAIGVAPGWHRIAITRARGHLTVVLDDRTVIEGATPAAAASEGPLGLASNGAVIEFANLYLRQW